MMTSQRVVSPDEFGEKREIEEWYKSYRENGKPYMTSFHVELAAGNTDYVISVLDSTGDEDVLSCLLNTPVITCRSVIPDGGDIRSPTPVTSSCQDDDGTSCEYMVRDTEILRDMHGIAATPLAVASFSGDPELILLLIRYGADVNTTGGEGNTIMHDLVYLSDKYPDRALRVYDALVRHLDRDQLMSLLWKENAKKLLPVDLAADLSLPEMLLAILRTDNVYRYVTANCGTHVHVRYDVSRYETDGPSNIHLLYYLTCVTEKELRRIDVRRMFDQEPISSWIKAKCGQYLRFLYVTLTEWLVLLAVYFSTLVYSSNYLMLPPTWMTVAVIVTCGLSLTFDLLNVHSQSRYVTVYWKRLRRCRVPVSMCGTYRLYHAVFCLSAIASACLTYVADIELTSPVYLGLTASGVLSGLVSLLFFSQLSDRLGHMLTAIEKMATVTVQFTLFISVIFLALTLSFYVLHFHAEPCRSDAAPSVVDGAASVDVVGAPAAAASTAPTSTSPGDGRHPDGVMFGTFARSAHETFLICLGVMVPRSIYFTESSVSSLAITLYAFCLLSMNIILFNLLLALINKRVNEIEAHKNSILVIKKLSVALFIANSRFVINKLTSRACRDHAIFQDPRDNRVYVQTIESATK